MTEPSPHSWPPELAPLLRAQPPAAGVPWQVLGGAGTGKTTLVVDAAAAAIEEGRPPASVLVLTATRRHAVAVRAALTQRLAAAQVASGSALRAVLREPLVRTVHSYAFGVLRLAAERAGNPPPQLLTAAEQDAIIRELLRGEAEDGAAGWSASLQPALGMAGFAGEVRELMLRAAERGVPPEELVALGKEHGRAPWVQVGRFASRYEQMMLLRSSVGAAAPEASAPALVAAEVVSAALTAFATDRQLLSDQRSQVRFVLVDDAQHLDPQAAHLVSLLVEAAECAVVAGDPDGSVFGFRGADPHYLLSLGREGQPQHLVLRTDFRTAPSIGALADVVARRLPGRRPSRFPQHSSPAAGTATVRVYPSAAKEATAVAAVLRAQHLREGVPYGAMAVILRSVGRQGEVMARALAAAGVPVQTQSDEVAVAERHGAAALLAVLRAVADPSFDQLDALELLAGPVGGADPLAVRRLRRGLRRVDGTGRDSGWLVAQLLLAAAGRGALAQPEVAELLGGLTEVESAELAHARTVIAATARAAASGAPPADILWAAWSATGLADRWRRAASGTSPLAEQANRDLDAVIELFDAAAEFADRVPGSRVQGFLEFVEGQQIALERRPRERTDAVALVSAHAAAGREWEVVAVAGVQEGLWPGLRSRSGILGTDAFVDLMAGIDVSDATVSRTAPVLAEERRLFLLAVTRARRVLAISAVDSLAGDDDLLHSRFLDELAGLDEGATPEAPLVRPSRPPRAATLPSLVAHLRSVVCDGAAPADQRGGAARQLARLAAAGVRGADPSSWYGLAPVSTEAPLWHPGDGPVVVSPSHLETLIACPLQWLLVGSGGDAGAMTAATTGSVTHLVAEALAAGVPLEDADAALERAWPAIDFGSHWYADQQLTRVKGMSVIFLEWYAHTRDELTEAGVEVPFSVQLAPEAEGQPGVELRGRVDRLEVDAAGRPVVVDIKTGANAPTKAEVGEHAQLRSYQLAVHAGAFSVPLPDVPEDEAGLPADPGGAALLYLGARGAAAAKQLDQHALDADEAAQWREVVLEAARASVGPTFTARRGPWCAHCPVQRVCPLQDAGRQVSGS